MLLAFCLVALLLASSSSIQTLTWWARAWVSRGFTEWEELSENQQPSWLQTALNRESTVLSSGPLHWNDLLPGLQVAELGVFAEGVEVEKIELVRLDPKLLDFQVAVDPAAYRDVEAWQKKLGAEVVINGSYYAADGFPLTPVRSDSVSYGPFEYEANHGAVVFSSGHAEVIDLQGKDWRQILARYPHALISYPLLLDEHGQSRVQDHEGWIANRSFVSQDQAGLILLGTTSRGFFSLRKLAGFLKSAPLDLRIALNLDGGPLACQAVRAGKFSRTVYGEWELQPGRRAPRILKQGRTRHWGLPIVIAAKKAL